MSSVLSMHVIIFRVRISVNLIIVARSRNPYKQAKHSNYNTISGVYVRWNGIVEWATGMVE